MPSRNATSYVLCIFIRSLPLCFTISSLLRPESPDTGILKVKFQVLLTQSCLFSLEMGYLHSAHSTCTVYVS